MQVLRQSITFTIQRSRTLIRPTLAIQQIRYDGGDPRSSTSSDNHKSGRSNNLNKSKGGEKKQKLSTTDDTKQPGTTRKDWSKPNQVVGNDPTYGKAGPSSNTNNPNQGKN